MKYRYYRLYVPFKIITVLSILPYNRRIVAVGKSARETVRDQDTGERGELTAQKTTL